MNATERKILIIEDDPIIANIYRGKLDHAGFDVEIAADGHAGFFRLHEARFDALLLDLMLPGMDGLDILRKIRAQKRFERFPVIVFTNAYLGKVAYEAREAGADQVFLKANTTPLQIVEAIQNLLCMPVPPAYSRKTALAPSLPNAGPIGAPVSESGLSGGEGMESEAHFQARLRESFLGSASATLIALRRQLQQLAQEQREEARLAQLVEIYRKVHSFTGTAALAGTRVLPQIGSVFEALLQELYSAPAYLNASTLRTMERILLFMEQLLTVPAEADVSRLTQASILVADHEEVSRRAAVFAVQKAELKCVAASDAAMAVALLELNAFDLVVVNLELANLGGLELLARMRVMNTHQRTPIIMIGGPREVDMRNPWWGDPLVDWVAKPFLLIELAAKILIFITRAGIFVPADSVAARPAPGASPKR